MAGQGPGKRQTASAAGLGPHYSILHLLSRHLLSISLAPGAVLEKGRAKKSALKTHIITETKLRQVVWGGLEMKNLKFLGRSPEEVTSEQSHGR